MSDIQQIKNFKEFLQLYNRVTELCFNSCVDNLYNRSLTDDEMICTEKCVDKFANVNHKILGSYVELQSEITNRRVAEIEAQQKVALEKRHTINDVAPLILTHNPSIENSSDTIVSS